MKTIKPTPDMKRRQELLLEFKAEIKGIAEICGVSEKEQDALFDVLLKVPKKVFCCV